MAFEFLESFSVCASVPKSMENVHCPPMNKFACKLSWYIYINMPYLRNTVDLIGGSNLARVRSGNDHFIHH